MFDWLKTYFQSTNSERKGALVLLCVLFCLFMCYFFSANNEAEIVILKNQLAAHPESISRKKINTKNYFDFNPNQLDKNGWIKLGFSERQVKTIMNYKNAIGGFKRPEQLLKLYVIDSSLYQNLYPYIKFKKETDANLKDQRFENKFKESSAILLLESNNPIYDRFEKIDNLFYKKQKGLYKYYTSLGKTDSLKEVKLSKVIDMGFDSAEIVYVDYRSLNDISFTNNISKIKCLEKTDLNNADTNDLKRIIGIGSILAKRVVKYRKLLGGFINIEQLKEVYGLSLDKYLSIESQITIVDSTINSLNINKLIIDSLYRHPYIDWNLANAIIQYRLHHGNYKYIEKIKSIHLVNDEIYCKIAPYLNID